MRAVFVPRDLKNPYQSLLAAELSALGVRADYAGSHPLSMLTSGAVWRADVLHLHWVDQLYLRRTALGSLVSATIVSATIAVFRLIGKRVVWTAHNLRNHEGRFPAIDNAMTRLVARLAHVVIAHCEPAREAVAATVGARVRDKTAVVPLGNYVSVYPSTIDATDARGRLALTGHPVVLFFGNIRPYKGVEDLVTAFRALDIPGAELVVAGQPRTAELADGLRRQAAGDPRITLALRFIAAEDLQLYFAAADVVVLPYLDVLTSAAAMVALSFGKPCIAPRIGCLGDLLDSTCAYLYDHSNPAGLGDALARALATGAPLERMGAAALIRAKAFDWRRTAELTRDAYEGRG